MDDVLDFYIFCRMFLLCFVALFYFYSLSYGRIHTDVSHHHTSHLPDTA